VADSENIRYGLGSKQLTDTLLLCVYFYQNVHLPCDIDCYFKIPLNSNRILSLYELPMFAFESDFHKYGDNEPHPCSRHYVNTMIFGVEKDENGEYHQDLIINY
jgi:hypothetical protein